MADLQESRVHPRRFRTSLALAAAAALVLVACSGDGGTSASISTSPRATGAPPPVSPTTLPSVTPSVTPPALPAKPPPTSGPTAVDCVNGWVTPPSGSNRANSPIGVIRRTTGIKGPLKVVDMRYFEGPESPPSDMGYLLVVMRWYVKLYSERDPSFQGRFLVEARRFGQGVSAVAPYDTTGWSSPDWVGFQFDSADTEAKAYPGLPGLWSGIPYDFVKGGAGLTIPGLPAEVVGCLDGT